MRILHLHDRLSSRGGADLYLLDLLEGLRQSMVLHLGVGRCDLDTNAPCDTSICPGLDARDKKSTALDELFKAFRPDVIHVHNVMNPTALEWIANHRAVITVHDHRAFCPGQGKWTLDGAVCKDPMSPEVCKKCFKDNDYFEHILSVTQDRLAALSRMQVVVLSQYMKNELVSVGVAEEQVNVVPPFVHPLPGETPQTGEPCVLFAGRLVYAKGVAAAVDAWRLSGVPYPLVFAGTGKEKGWLEKQGFEVLGWQSRSDLAKTYRRCVALLMPSRWQEPFGIVGLEAMAFGVPVVTWKSGGIEEWHSGEFLVPWGDIEALAKALGRAVGTRSTFPPGFERKDTVSRMHQIYEQA